MTAGRRRIVWAAVIAAGALTLWWLWRPRPIAVDVTEVRRGPLVVTVDEEGETRVRERYVVAAPTSGRLLRIVLDEGDPVAAGQAVASIEPAPLGPRDLAAAQARLEAAQATERAASARMARAEAALAQARRDAARAERLHRAGTISDDAREKARLAETSALREHEEARYAADAALHEIEAARAVLIAAGAGTAASGSSAEAAPSGDDGGPPCTGGVPCVEARAPVGGQVLRVLEESERIVVAGTPLLEVGDPAALEVVSDLLSRDAVRVTPGARVLVEDWGGPGALEARVRRVEPSGFTKISALGVEEQRVNVISDLVAPEPRLGDGYRVEVRIVVWEGADAVQVPASALFRLGDEWAVFVVEGGRARRRIVAVGELGSFEAEIREGLAEGEVVVLHPSDRLRDGARVARRR
jgi:HlyD family secretion protein